MDEVDESESSCASKLHYLVICLGGYVCKVGEKRKKIQQNHGYDLIVRFAIAAIPFALCFQSPNIT
jgi:hypothetical protein